MKKTEKAKELLDEIKVMAAKAGRKLTKREVAMLGAISEEPVARSDGFEKVWATNIIELADMIGCDRRTITRHLEKHGHKANPAINYPGRKADGKYHVEKWRAFVKPEDVPRTGALDGVPDGLGGTRMDDPDFSDAAPRSKTDWEIEKLKEVVRGLKFEQAVREGRYSLNDEVIRWSSETMMQVRTILLSVPSKLAPEIAMRETVEAEKLLKHSIDEALQIIHERDWGATHPTPEAE